jgi:transcriptional regulator with XRE-family HTH domain
MGTRARHKPKRLAEKLRRIRETLGISQSEMLRRLDVEDEVSLKRMSDYELGVREPSLMTLLQYSRVAGVHTEALIDDNLDLPEQLPSTAKHEEIKRLYTARQRSKR